MCIYNDYFIFMLHYITAFFRRPKRDLKGTPKRRPNETQKISHGTKPYRTGIKRCRHPPPKKVGTSFYRRLCLLARACAHDEIAPSSCDDDGASSHQKNRDVCYGRLGWNTVGLDVIVRMMTSVPTKNLNSAPTAKAIKTLRKRPMTN